MRKLKLGLFSFTCDEGCSIIFLELMNKHFFEWEKLIDFRHIKLLRSKNTLKGLDVALIEGAISTFKEEKELKEIRKNAKKLAAIGSCAVNGIPSNQRNYFDEGKRSEIQNIMDEFGHKKKVFAPKEIVKIDYFVPECPMNEKTFLEVINKLLKEFVVI